MKKVWRRAVGVVKDKNSIYLAGLSRRTVQRNPQLEAIVIKATSHDETWVDYKNFQRVYQWARASPLYMRPFIGSVSRRMERTRSWVVALKGLMLVHGVLCCKNVPAAHRIGRLPFDLSAFADAHSSRAWGFNAFVRSYFAFLDRRSAFLTADNLKFSDLPLPEELLRLVSWQSLLDLLLQVKPQTENMVKVGLIFEAMICVLTEVFEVYSRICRGIARALVRVYEAPAGRKAENARLALGVLRKARDQGDDLSIFFDLCREMGVLSSSCSPKVERIPDEDLRELERIINGVTEENAIVLVQHEEEINGHSEKVMLKTIVTDKWEVFEEEHGFWRSSSNSYNNNNNHNSHDYALIEIELPCNRVLPDLISF